MLPSDRDGTLSGLALEVVMKSAELDRVLRPPTRAGLIHLLREMNSYYSNFIEGHNTHPLLIERALKADFADEPAKRALQLEARAHIEVQQLLEERLRKEPELNICAADLLRWIHREFYTRMPETFRLVRGSDGHEVRVEPGELRTLEVSVGHHVAPSHHSLPAFLERFGKVYARLRGIERVIAAAASHHRLAWIHPFLDGNGRVTRLFTHAFMIRAGTDGHGLWTITRGLARRRDAYLSALAAGDEPRRGDLDGRGNLSDAGLRLFCEFFLGTAIDQIDFMSELLDLGGLEQRICGFVERQVAAQRTRPEAAYLLREALLRGELPRGEAPRVTGLAERSARKLVSELVRAELLTSESPKGNLRLGFPARVVGYYFPKLYPEAIEATLDR